jgi:thiol-disulfide isomerase/thioredoxin
LSAKQQRVITVLGGLAVVCLFAMAIAGARIMGYDPTRRSDSPLIGRPVPSLSLPIVSGDGASQGDRIAFEALRGKIVVLDFWASWCGPCRRAIPALNTIHERYGSRVEMFGINVETDMPRRQVAEAHRSFGAHFRSLQDEAFAAQGAFGVQSIPTLVIVDAQGVVRWVQSGVPDPDEVAQQLDALLAND